MRLERPLRSDAIELRTLETSDVTPTYVGWLTNPEINRFLEVRLGRPTLENTCALVAGMVEDPNNLMLAMVERTSGSHVGNIKLGPIDRHHGHAAIGLLIGDKGVWGRGYGSAAIALLTGYAFRVLGLAKVWAGFYEGNIGSIRAFEKAGWSHEARLRSHVVDADGRRIDSLLMARWRAEWVREGE